MVFLRSSEIILYLFLSHSAWSADFKVGESIVYNSDYDLKSGKDCFLFMQTDKK